MLGSMTIAVGSRIKSRAHDGTEPVELLGQPGRNGFPEETASLSGAEVQVYGSPARVLRARLAGRHE